MTNDIKRNCVWVLGFSGLPLGFAGFITIYRLAMMYRTDMQATAIFLGVIAFFLILIGMVELATRIDVKYKIGFMESTP